MNARKALTIAALIASAFVAGCATMRYDAETISGGTAAGPGARAYRAGLSAMIAADRVARIDATAGGAAPFAEEAASGSSARRALAAEAAALDGKPFTAPAAGPDVESFDGDWRTARDTLFLAPATPGESGSEFRFGGDQAKRIDLAFNDITGNGVTVDLSCDGPVTRGRRTGETLRFAIQPAAPKPLVLTVDRSVTRCDAVAAFPGKGRRHYTLVRAEAEDRALAALDSRYDICQSAPAGSGDRLTRVFFAARWLSQTCAFDPGNVETLREERAAFNGKVRVLLGRDLPGSFIDRANPYAPIDFSAAPRLSLIYVSYLDIKADFTGKVLDRLLRHHAARGATIRIIATKILERDKDRDMLYRLAADYPNVAYREFLWKAPAGSGLEGKIVEAIRVHHVKMLAGLSPDRGRSSLVVGSRNIHDGYLYRDPVDMSAWPELNQYTRSGGMTLDYYSNWTDFDLSIREDGAVRKMMAHLSTFWNGDADTWLARPMSVGGKAKPGVTGRGLMRHFLSVPFADGRALEDYYVDLFGAASHSIEIVNPYLNFTEKLRTAFEAALDRGVKVTIVGRINLYGDLAGSVLTELNTLFLARYGDRITFREFRDPGVLLHSKILMIDEELVVVSSVNLNNRSFLHDTENGVMMLDRGFYRQMKQVFDFYFANAEHVSYEKGSAFWKAVLSIRIVREAM